MFASVNSVWLRSPVMTGTYQHIQNFHWTILDYNTRLQCGDPLSTLSRLAKQIMLTVLHASSSLNTLTWTTPDARAGTCTWKWDEQTLCIYRNIVRKSPWKGCGTHWTDAASDELRSAAVCTISNLQTRHMTTTHLQKPKRSMFFNELYEFQGIIATEWWINASLTCCCSGNLLAKLTTERWSCWIRAGSSYLMSLPETFIQLYALTSVAPPFTSISQWQQVPSKQNSWQAAKAATHWAHEFSLLNTKPYR